MTSTKYNIAFFGTDKFAVICIDKLKEAGLTPNTVISAPDKKHGRGLSLSPTPTKFWAMENHVPCLQPEVLDAEFTKKLADMQHDVFVVVYYNKIIPKRILDIPKFGSLNIHPSLLPKYRGPSPVKTQILNDEKDVGVTIILLDEKMDHGPILDQRSIDSELLPMPEPELMQKLSIMGSEMLVEVLPKWFSGDITPKEQNHESATFTKMIRKEDGELNGSESDRKKYLKYLAFKKWPGVYFFQEARGKNIRIKIAEAKFIDGEFLIGKIIPEGKREMSYEDFKRNL